MMLRDAPILSLTKAETDSPLWKRLAAHFADRLESLRTRNDSMMTEPERCLLLGRIAEVKAFVRLGDEFPAVDQAAP